MVYFRVLPQHSPGRTVENHEKHQLECSVAQPRTEPDMVQIQVKSLNHEGLSNDKNHNIRDFTSLVCLSRKMLHCLLISASSPVDDSGCYQTCACKVLAEALLGQYFEINPTCY